MGDRTKTAKRAIRRFHKRRMKDKAIRVYHWCDEKNAIKMADHLKTCSNPWCCGNPRAFYGATIAEKKAEDAAKEAVKDL